MLEEKFIEAVRKFFQKGEYKPNPYSYADHDIKQCCAMGAAAMSLGFNKEFGFGSFCKENFEMTTKEMDGITIGFMGEQSNPSRYAGVPAKAIDIGYQLYLEFPYKEV